ncbi:MAG: energy-coupling factor transporter transmembrane protein EcfT [Thermanaeromonas sp.]|uniref:energy-coupling factor transporter transmembrane component T family protein n=1 Tax=Thermanaeromonas sp. TaxID=2003697 RepID=UPI00243792A4|nr:energy-coupling factor transporter transmembrane protein EcfT [Thermanaeromonas sp.]
MGILFYGIGILGAPGPGGTYLLGIPSLVAVAVSGLPARFLWRQLRPLILFLVIILILEALLIPGAELVTLGPLVVSREGLYQGLTAAGRVLFLLVAAFLLTATTSPLDLARGLESLLKPGRKLKLPVEEFSLMLTLALRFVPTLLEEAERISKAQAARGFTLEGRNLLKKGMSLLPLVVPLFVSTLRRAEDLAQALEARGYRPGSVRTSLKTLEMRWPDYIFLLSTLLLATTAFIWR